LREAFEIGRIRGYDTTFYLWWQPAEMTRLCAEAFAAGIEVGYAIEMVRRQRLVPEGSLETQRLWPWPVRIYTLGRFTIEVDSAPLPFPARSRRNPSPCSRRSSSSGGKRSGKSKCSPFSYAPSLPSRCLRCAPHVIFRGKLKVGRSMGTYGPEEPSRKDHLSVAGDDDALPPVPGGPGWAASRKDLAPGLLLSCSVDC
jgi:hypothetical protein